MTSLAPLAPLVALAAALLFAAPPARAGVADWYQKTEAEKVGKLTADDVAVTPAADAAFVASARRAWADLGRRHPELAASWDGLRARMHAATVSGDDGRIDVTLELLGRVAARGPLEGGGYAIDLSALGFDRERGDADLVAICGILADEACAKPGALDADGKVVRPGDLGRARNGERGSYRIQLIFSALDAAGTGLDEVTLALSNTTADSMMRPKGTVWMRASTNIPGDKHVHETFESTDRSRAIFRLPESGDARAAAIAGVLGVKVGAVATPSKKLESLDDRRGLPLPWGAPRKDVLALLGAPDAEKDLGEPKGVSVLVYAPHGISVMLRDGAYGGCEVSFDGNSALSMQARVEIKNCSLRTARGITGGAKIDALKAAYGAPTGAGGGSCGVFGIVWTAKDATVVARYDESSGLEALSFEAPGGPAPKTPK